MMHPIDNWNFALPMAKVLHRANRAKLCLVEKTTDLSMNITMSISEMGSNNEEDAVNKYVKK